MLGCDFANKDASQCFWVKVRLFNPVKWILRLFAGPVAKATVSTSGVLGLRLMVQAGTLLIVARILGAAGFGAYSGMAALAVLLGTLVTFGTHLVLLGEASKDPVHRHEVLPYALPTTLLMGGLLFVTYLILASWVMHQAGIGITIVLAIGAAELLLQPLIMLASTELQAHGYIARSQLLMTLPLGLRLLIAIGVWVIQPQEPLTLFALGYLLVTGLAVGVAVWHLPEPWPKIREWRFASKEELKQSAGYAVLNLTALGPSELDKTLAVKLMPLGAVGVYAVGTRIVGALVLPVMAMLLAALPRLFRESPSATNGSRLVHGLFWVALFYGVFAGLGLWLMSPFFAFLFGNSYQDLKQVLPLLALVVPGLTLRFAAGSILMSKGKPWRRVAFELLGMAVLVIFALLLVPVLPTSGMPLALAVAEWAMALSGWWLVLTTLRGTGSVDIKGCELKNRL